MRLSHETLVKLRNIGTMGDTYEDVILRLYDFYTVAKIKEDIKKRNDNRA
jgi:hypothetical protein